MTAKIGAAISGVRDSELEHRIAATPPDAEIRAIFLHVADEALARELPSRTIGKRPRGYTMVPVRSFLEEIHHLGAQLGPTTEAGIARLFGQCASYLLDHPGARLFVTERDRDPLVLLGRLERSRSMLASYGDWRVTGTRGDVLVTVHSEWTWLDSMWCSVIRSMFSACNVPPGSIELANDTPFSATIRVRW